MNQNNQSEVSRLLAQISSEYEAAQRALSSFAEGGARHAFITTRMENMGNLNTKLVDLMGDEAIALIATTIDESPTTALGTVDEFGVAICPECQKNGIRMEEQDSESIFASYQCLNGHEFEIDRVLEYVPVPVNQESFSAL
jgi:hypothetical protein